MIGSGGARKIGSGGARKIGSGGARKFPLSYNLTLRALQAVYANALGEPGARHRRKQNAPAFAASTKTGSQNAQERNIKLAE